MLGDELYYLIFAMHSGDSPETWTALPCLATVGLWLECIVDTQPLNCSFVAAVARTQREAFRLQDISGSGM